MSTPEEVALGEELGKRWGADIGALLDRWSEEMTELSKHGISPVGPLGSMAKTLRGAARFLEDEARKYR